MSTEPSAPGPTTVPIETIRHLPLKSNAGETKCYECQTGTETIESPASSSDTVDPVGRDSADMPAPMPPGQAHTETLQEYKQALEVSGSLFNDPGDKYGMVVEGEKSQSPIGPGTMNPGGSGPGPPIDIIPSLRQRQGDSVQENVKRAPTETPEGVLDDDDSKTAPGSPKSYKRASRRSRLWSISRECIVAAAERKTTHSRRATIQIASRFCRPTQPFQQHVPEQLFCAI